jgi:hypothetical protein
MLLKCFHRLLLLVLMVLTSIKVSTASNIYDLKCLSQVRSITVFTVFRLLTDFVCLYTYEFWLSLWKIVRRSVILLLPIFIVSAFFQRQIVRWICRWYLAYTLYSTYTISWSLIPLISLIQTYFY